MVYENVTVEEEQNNLVVVEEEDHVTQEEESYKLLFSSDKCGNMQTLSECDNFTRFSDIVTFKVKLQLKKLETNVRKVVDALNTFPQKFANGALQTTRLIGGKIWAFGDLMSGLNDNEAPFSPELLQIIDKLYKQQPALIPIILEKAKVIKAIPIAQRSNYILSNPDQALLFSGAT
jgi:hypothetical protein